MLRPLDPVIVKVLDVATRHITFNDFNILAMASDTNSRCVDGLPIVYEYDEGFFVYVHDFEIDVVKEGYRGVGLSDAFIALIDLARMHECKYLQIDADGTEYDELQKFTLEFATE